VIRSGLAVETRARVAGQSKERILRRARVALPLGKRVAFDLTQRLPTLASVVNQGDGGDVSRVIELYYSQFAERRGESNGDR
jgi:hypothetical protein